MSGVWGRDKSRQAFPPQNLRRGCFEPTIWWLSETALTTAPVLPFYLHVVIYIICFLVLDLLFWGSHVWKIIRLLLQGNRRETRLLGILSFIHSTVWKVLFGKVLCPSCDCLFWFMSILAVGWLEFVFIKLYHQWFLDCKSTMSWTRWLMDPQTQVARAALMAATPHQEVYWLSKLF